MKFLVLWAIVITADFMFMFRFEFLWPFWLLVRSVHDSFKYKGLAFSVLFVCIAITSDLVCLFFIPVHWLLFAASTYVWVQYVWHTDKGICLPTIILWMLFVYLEAGIRWKDSRHMPHLDLCRPFAAHCIGYPVVTLGFGFKSYVGYRMRQRKQREVAKENEFYMQLLQQALPQEETPDDTQQITAVTSATIVTVTANTAQSVQNSSHSNATTHVAIAATATVVAAAVTTTTTTSNAIISANGILAAQAQNHHNHHSQTNDNHTHHNSSSSGSSSNSINNNTISSILNTTTTTTSTATSGSANNSTSTSNSSDDKSYVQISGGGGGNASNSTASLTHQHNQQHNHQNSNHHHNNSNLHSNHIAHQTHNHHHQSSNNNSKNAQSNSTSNGYIGANSKSHRRSVDKDKNRGSAIGDNESKHNKSSNYQQYNSDNSNNSNSNNNNNNNKDKTDSESNNYQVNQTHQHNSKEKSDEHRLGSHSSSLKKANSQNAFGNTTPVVANGNISQYDMDDVIVVEPVEKTKGRRNRSKKDNASKDNHHQHHNNNNNNSYNSNSTSNHLHTQQQQNKDVNSHNNNNNNNNSSNNNNNNSNTNNNNNNSDASSVSSSSSTSSSSSASLTISNIASKVVSKICESCLKLEADIKKCRSEISHQKQIENELRQKLESNLTTKSCLQAKQKDCDELEKRINELTSARHADTLQLQTAERRLNDERRQKQSLEAQLNNEKKARKLAEEKAARPECSAQCKQRKQQMDEEIKQLRRDVKAAEESKQMAEQQGRQWEQELRMFEAEIRNRESNQPGTEVLMNALQAMQDKNCTLEKNLSAETRVKLDLFSALGDAKRQLELSENLYRSKEDEVFDLKAKIAQLLAVMPTDSLCLPVCSSTGASQMLRMNDTPPLQTGPGPSSPMLNSLSVQQVNGPVGHQLNARLAPSSVGEYVQQAPPSYVTNQHPQQCAGIVPVSVATAVLVPGPPPGNGSSNLDPNATVYTPKCGPNCTPGVVVVCGPNDA
ncbi:macoilin-2-like isoform X2 [Teleopsis dalmanni]|nr:macoilin-2-like isoform X2 [Teleopsis dalmanni]